MNNMMRFKIVTVEITMVLAVIAIDYEALRSRLPDRSSDGISTYEKKLFGVVDFSVTLLSARSRLGLVGEGVVEAWSGKVKIGIPNCREKVKHSKSEHEADATRLVLPMHLVSIIQFSRRHQ